MPDPDRPTSQIVFFFVAVLLPYLQVNRLPFPHMIHPCRPIRDMGLGAPFDSNAQVWTAITQPGLGTNLIARSLKMKQGQDEWGRDGPYSRPFQFQRIRPRGYRHIANQKSNYFWQKKYLIDHACFNGSIWRIGAPESGPGDRAERGDRASQTGLAGLASGLGLGTKCKKIRRISQISLCHWLLR